MSLPFLKLSTCFGVSTFYEKGGQEEEEEKKINLGFVLQPEQLESSVGVSDLLSALSLFYSF